MKHCKKWNAHLQMLKNQDVLDKIQLKKQLDGSTKEKATILDAYKDLEKELSYTKLQLTNKSLEADYFKLRTELSHTRRTSEILSLAAGEASLKMVDGPRVDDALKKLVQGSIF